MPTDASMATDPRTIAFCSPHGPDIFRHIAYPNEIWSVDPLDVESIHEPARDVFRSLLDRATRRDIEGGGKVLLLRGESGSGKTHLMRAFRGLAHERGLAYVGYMQMTSAVNDYARYVLSKLIDSLDQPYCRPMVESSGLMRLSNAVAESPAIAPSLLERLRADELTVAERVNLVHDLADEASKDNFLYGVDLDLLRAMLFLQCDNPGIRGRVIKYLRGEDLSAPDRQRLEIVPRSEESPLPLIVALGKLMWLVHNAALVLCVDQFEDILSLEQGNGRFPRAMQALTAIAAELPSALIVVSCLDNYYDAMRSSLNQSVLDRIEKDPAPVILEARRSEPDIIAIASRHLEYLYDEEGTGAEFDPLAPTFPIDPRAIKPLINQTARSVLLWLREYRQRCMDAGAIVDAAIDGAGLAEVEIEAPSSAHDFEQEWEDYLCLAGAPPEREEEQAKLLARAIEGCSDECDDGLRFSADVEGRHLVVRIDGAAEGSADLLQVGICNRRAQNNALRRQIEEVQRLAAGQMRPATVALVRSTEYPANSKTEVARLLARVISAGGRRVVSLDADWRAMIAMTSFRERHGDHPDFADWLRRSKPLTRRPTFRDLLDLEHLKPAPAATRATEAETSRSSDDRSLSNGTGANGSLTADSSDRAEAPQVPMEIGQSNDRSAKPVTIVTNDLARHMAFLGATGSGKTVAALNIIEQLALRGIPAILVDRKGDLCCLARQETFTAPATMDDPALASRQGRLRDCLEVAVYTPGNSDGRPIALPVVPVGLAEMSTADREQMARLAAHSLGAMMGYKTTGKNGQRIAVLGKAIEILGSRETTAVTLKDLVEYIAEQDSELINAIGRLDVKLFDQLVGDLETLCFTKKAMFPEAGEPLSAETLFGLRSGRRGKTHVSVISTKFLGSRSDAQFWVAQLLLELSRWMSKSPSEDLQAVVLFDEADIYLPAIGNPASKEPMENLLKRARSAGLGILLATQSPGDFDYKLRENIHTWLVGKVKEDTALRKMKPMLSECKIDVSARLPGQGPGEFFLVHDGDVLSVRGRRSVVQPTQLAEDEILRLARASRE